MSTAAHADLSKHRNLYFSIRDAVMSQKLSPGQRLPASRTLASDLGLSRNTVISAYEQLMADGFLSSRKGAGTFVSDKLPEIRTTADKKPSISIDGVSERGRALMQTGKRNQAYGGPLFIPGMPDATQFPEVLWNRIARKCGRTLSNTDFGYGGGYLPLRQTIAEYLRLARAVKCDAEQVMITCGTNQALNFVIQMLTSPGDIAWIEEPGYHIAQATLQASLLETHYITLDEHGLVINQASSRANTPKVIYLTPSYQFPKGITMSLTRRLEILEFAAKHDCWIFEDDYDSEFRYDTTPLASLQGLDTGDRVIYMGTFSKTLNPALRLSYIVVPPQLVEHFAAGYQSLGNESALPGQVTMNEFIRAGHFETHVRKMRSLYAERREALIATLRPYLDSKIGLQDQISGGLHLYVPLSAPVTDKEIVSSASKEGMGCRALSQYFAGNSSEQGLLLGYTSCDTDTIENGVHRLMEIISGR